MRNSGRFVDARRELGFLNETDDSSIGSVGRNVLRFSDGQSTSTSSDFPTANVKLLTGARYSASSVQRVISGYVDTVIAVADILPDVDLEIEKEIDGLIEKTYSKEAVAITRRV
ncbi:hypothetical protein IB286_14550 [Spongiibacter sp. KMU-158]|uniref:Uncharacterized protein n=1 Tax=Spongiibacter pelagi TaxID=2760804 RepID=A0A927C2Q6_9GAMM|nr:hypothetical protein [Spongiibacter pelagi]MBD2860218.1 hypothetical protein [Spongiibacter pelagi]